MPGVSVLLFEDGVFETSATAGIANVGRTNIDDSSNFQDTMRLVRQALQEVKIKETEIDDIIIIGGSENVHTSLESYFGKTAHTGIDEDEVVAHGAAKAGIYMQPDNKGCLMDPVYPLTLGKSGI